MGYSKTTWKDRVVQKPLTFNKTDNPDGTITLSPAPGIVTEPGTAVNAAVMNKIENGIASALTGIGQNYLDGSSGTVSLNPNASNDVVITFPAGTFTVSPNLTYSIVNSDVDGAYTTAHSIVAKSKDGATIRIKNRGSVLQYYIVNWKAVGV